MENSLFSAALSPILTRSCAVRSSGRKANNFLRSSTPLRGVTTNTQQPAGPKVQRKSAGSVCTAAKPDRKRIAHTDGVREKNAKRALSTVATGKNNRLMSSTADRSRHIDSLTGKLQQQKREELTKRKCRQRKAGNLVEILLAFIAVYSDHVCDCLQHPIKKLFSMARCFDVLTNAGGCIRDNQQVPVLRDVMVKNSLYARWKPVSSESIKMVVRAFEAACGDVSSADTLVNSSELKQLHREIKQELQKLKVPPPSAAYDTISARMEALEREVDEAQRDVDCLSTELQDTDRCIKKTARKLPSYQQHDSESQSMSLDEEELVQLR